MSTITVDGVSKETLGYFEDIDFKGRFNDGGMITVDGVSKPVIGRQYTQDSVTAFKVKNVKDTTISKGSGASTYTRASTMRCADYTGALVQLPLNMPAYPGLRLSYDVNEGAVRGSIINSGGLTVGNAYEIISRLALDFTALGAANNNVGTVFIATAAGTMDANNTAKQATPVWRDTISISDTTPIIPNAYYKGLLSEPAATNVLLQSQDLNTTWVPNGATITVNAATAPDGTLTMDKIVESAGVALHRDTQMVTQANGQYTGSIFLKAAERTKALLTLSDGTTGVVTAYVDLTNGQLLAETETAGSWTGRSAGVEAYPNGVYRVSITGTRGAGTVTTFLVTVGDGTNNSYATTYNGNGTSGIYAWGGQLETGGVATSYIPTTTATSTRAATVDGYDKSNSKLGDITVYTEVVFNAIPAASALIFGHGDGASFTTIQWEVIYSTGGSYFGFQMSNGTTSFSANKAGAAVVGTRYKISARLSGTTLDIFVNGVKGSSATLTGTQSTYTGNIAIGGQGAYVTDNAYHGQSRIYSSALTDADCIRLTT